MYLMENDREAERLEFKTNPDEVRRRLELVGVEPGMRVLDAGAGSGAVSRVISDLVGGDGSVVALDKSTDRAAFTAKNAALRHVSRLRVVQGDLYHLPFTSDSFDLVWCEFVFEYLHDPALAATTLARVVRPGGKLVIADLDGYAQFHHPMPPDVARGLQLVTHAIEPHFDPFAGRKIFHVLRRAGLAQIHVHMLPYHFYAGAAPTNDIEHWRWKFQTISAVSAPALGGDGPYAQWVNSYLDMLRDPDRFSYSVLLIGEGVREMPTVDR
jgi:ubiquinone/menaquinone biosynthesis C-methylase UbiE